MSDGDLTKAELELFHFEAPEMIGNVRFSNRGTEDAKVC